MSLIEDVNFADVNIEHCCNLSPTLKIYELLFERLEQGAN